MNDLQTRQGTQSATYSAASELTIELGKMLALVAPSSMTAEQQEMWLCAAVDALQGIHAGEVRAISAKVRRSVTRHNQIVPEVAKLVADRRSSQARFREFSQPQLAGPPPKKHVMDRRGEPMSEEDTEELNRILENLKATARYRPDGSRYMIERQA